MLIESHLTYCSVETISKKIAICERHVYKGDIFSFGCILYELVHLRPAFENRFLLPNEDYVRVIAEIGQNERVANYYSADLKAFTKCSMEFDAQSRPSIRQIFNLDMIKTRLSKDYLDAYKAQVIPRLVIDKKSGSLEYLKVKLENCYKPVSMKSLKFNQNLIVVLAYKQTTSATKYKILASTLNNLSPFGQKEEILLNENNLGNILKENTPSPTPADTDSDLDLDFDMKFLVYNEFGELLTELNSFVYDPSCMLNQQNSQRMSMPNMDGQLPQRCPLSFKVSDFLVDEEYDHLYLSTKKHGILRFKIVENNFYMEDLIFDGRLDLSELYDEQNRVLKCVPTCLSLVENETVFKDSIRTTGNFRLLNKNARVPYCLDIYIPWV